jgi:hypothetical protein
MLGERFAIRHSTLQVDHASARLLSIGRPPEAPPPAPAA